MNISKWNSYDWLGKIKQWCSEDELLSGLTLPQQAKIATRLSFFFMGKDVVLDREDIDESAVS